MPSDRPAGHAPIAGALAGGNGTVPLSSNKDDQHDQLTDTQCVLLLTAAARESLGIYPLPASLKPGGGLLKTLTALSTLGPIEERETTDATAVSCTDGDYRYSLYITLADLTVMGIECDGEPSTEKAEKAHAPKVERITKTSAILDLLRNERATLVELIAAT